MPNINCKSIFNVFFKIGLILLGGGYVIIPIMKRELIQKRNWLEEEELYNYYSISQCLPGIIAVNMAILAGYKLMKLKGAITALFAMSISPFISIILIANILTMILKLSFIEGVFWGINLSVIILIYLTLKDMWAKSMTDIFSYVWFFIILLLSVLKISPVPLITISILLGTIIGFSKEKINE